MQIIRSGARLILSAALTFGSLACSRIQHVETAPVGAIADSMPGADRKTAPVPVDTQEYNRARIESDTSHLSLTTWE